MNKLLWIIATLTISVVTLAACGGSNGGGGSGNQATATAAPPTSTPLPAGSSEARQIALQASELPEGWVEVGGAEVAVVGGGAGASGWAVDFSNATTNETLTNSVFVYEEISEVKEPFNAKYDELYAPGGLFTSLGNMGSAAFYLPGDAESPHTIWVRRKNIMTSFEFVTEGTTGKPDTIVIAKILDDRLALASIGY